MDLRPIGVFDSGLGGLSVLKELCAVLPGEDIIYFGDTGRVPYGGRSPETIVKYAKQDIRFLMSHDIKAILIACGTVSSVLHIFREDVSLPCLGIAEATAKNAIEQTRNGRIGVIGTATTISSGIYERVISENSDGIETLGIACPLFVPLVEHGRVEPGDVVIETIAREYLAPFPDFGCDTLILGCTHYPPLKRIISNVLPGVRLIDPGCASSLAFKDMLCERDIMGRDSGEGSISYHVSDDPGNFSRLGSIFMEREIRVDYRKVDIENY